MNTPQNDTRPKRPRRIEARTGEIRPGKHCNEQRQPESNRRDEGASLFLRSEEEDRQDEEDGQEHLDEHALGDGSAAAELGADDGRPREEGVGDCGGDDAAEELDDDEEEAEERGHAADEDEAKRYLRY